MVCIMGWTRLGVTLFAMHKNAIRVGVIRDGLDFLGHVLGLDGLAGYPICTLDNFALLL